MHRRVIAGADASRLWTGLDEAAVLLNLLGMQLVVDTRHLVDAAARWQTAAELARALAQLPRHVGDGIVDPVLADALRAVADVCGSALDVVALDCELLSSLVRQGSDAYAAFEQSLAGGAAIR